jgi:hypothetical protein
LAVTPELGHRVFDGVGGHLAVRIRTERYQRVKRKQVI